MHHSGAFLGYLRSLCRRCLHRTAVTMRSHGVTGDFIKLTLFVSVQKYPIVRWIAACTLLILRSCPDTLQGCCWHPQSPVPD